MFACMEELHFRMVVVVSLYMNSEIISLYIYNEIHVELYFYLLPTWENVADLFRKKFKLQR